MFLTAFTLAHVVVSLVGIASGFVVLYGLITAKRLNLWAAIFVALGIVATLQFRGEAVPHTAVV